MLMTKSVGSYHVWVNSKYLKNSALVKIECLLCWVESSCCAIHHIIVQMSKSTATIQSEYKVTKSTAINPNLWERPRFCCKKAQIMLPLHLAFDRLLFQEQFWCISLRPGGHLYRCIAVPIAVALHSSVVSRDTDNAREGWAGLNPRRGGALVGVFLTPRRAGAGHVTLPTTSVQTDRAASRPAGRGGLSPGRHGIEPIVPCAKPSAMTRHPR